MDPFFFLAKDEELHPARISLPARIRRPLSRQASGADDRLRAGRLVVSLRQPARRSFRLLVPPDPRSNAGRGRRSRRDEAQTARFRFATCGGALLRVNGEEVACLSRLSAQFRGGGRGRCPARGGREPRRSLVRRPLRARCALSISSCRFCGATVWPSRCRSGRRGSGRRRRSKCCSRHALRAAVLPARAKSRSLLPQAATHGFRRARRGGGDFMSAEPAPGALHAEARRKPARARHGRDASGRFPPFHHHDRARRLRAVADARRRDLRHRGSAEPPASIEARAAEALRHVAERAEPDTVAGAGAARDRAGRRGDRCDARGEPAADPRLPRLRRFPARAAALVPHRLCRRHRARRPARESTRRSSASATGWTSRATT